MVFAAQYRAEPGLPRRGVDPKARRAGTAAVQDCLYTIADLADALIAVGGQSGSIRADGVATLGTAIHPAMGVVYDDLNAATGNRA